MSSPLAISAIGIVVEVVTAGEEAEELELDVRAAWSRCLAPTAGAPLVRVTAGVGLTEADGVVTGGSRAEVMELLTQEITLEAVTAGAGELLMLHACVLADPTSGAAAVMVGPSGMGKTTLAADLGRRWGYVTDETAAVTVDGALVPYPKPLSVVTSGSPKAQHSPDDLDLLVSEGPARPRAVLLLDRQRSLPQANVLPVPLADALSVLAEHTSYLGRLAQPLHRLADLVETCGGLGRLTYSDTAQLQPVLDELLGGLDVITLAPEVVDFYVAPDGRSAVMVAENVAVLSELATVLLQHLSDGPRSREQLTDRVVAALGEPPEGVGAASAVAAALDALSELGALAEESS